MAVVDSTVPPGPLADPAARRREQRAWYVYDWANSAFVTTVGTVLVGPYLTAVATASACPDLADGEDCEGTVALLGFLDVDPNSLVPFLISISTVVIALLLPFVGAVADRSSRKRVLMARFAWAGAAAATALVLVTGDAWALGATLLVVGNACLAASLTVYDAILVDVAAPDERDRVSSRGWALGYLGGFLLLVVNLGVVLGAGSIGLSDGLAVRISLASAGLWWAAFTLVPYLGLKDRPAVAVVGEQRGGLAGLVGGTFRQLRETLREARNYPQTLLFLGAYVLFNDGVQTVIAVSSIYGSVELGFATDQLIVVIVVVQAVAFAGALLFGRIARHPRGQEDHPRQPVRVGGGRRRGLQPAGRAVRAVRGPGRRDRARPGRHPGAQPLAVQPARPRGQAGRVLQPLPGRRARDVVVRDAHLRPGPAAHRLVPAEHPRRARLLRPRRLPAAPARRAQGHHRRRQRGADRRLTGLRGLFPYHTARPL